MINPFNTWARKRSTIETQLGLNNVFDDSFEFGGSADIVLGKSKLGGSPFSIPVAIKGLPLQRVGSTYYSQAGSFIKEDGSVLSATQNAYLALREATSNPDRYVKRMLSEYPEANFSNVINPNKRAFNKFDAIKLANKINLQGSRSTLSSNLGMDYGLAFQRSKMMNVMDVNFTVSNAGSLGGTRSLREHLKVFDRLKNNYYRSGGRELVQRQGHIDKFYKALVSSVEGSTVLGRKVYMSSIKDSLFRDHGVVSTLGVHDLSANATSSLAAKGFHHFAKLFGYDRSDLSNAGLSLPSFTAAQYGGEMEAYRKLFNFETSQDRLFSTRYSANTFLSLSDSRMLADSRSIAGERIFRLVDKSRYNTIHGMSRRSKQVIIAGASDVNALDFHAGISDDVKAIIQGATPEGMYRTDSGAYLYHKQKVIAAEAKHGRRSFLGKHSTMGDVSGDRGVLSFDRFGKGNINVLGYEMTGHGGGAVKIIYGTNETLTSNLGNGKKVFERASIIGGRRVMQRAVNKTFLTNRGEMIDQVIRGADLGIKEGKIGEDFLSNFLTHAANISGQQGKISNMAQFLKERGAGGVGVKRYRGHQYMHLTSATAGMGENLFQNVAALVSASEGELSSLGLSKEDVSILQMENGQFALNKSALRTMRLGSEEHVGVYLRGLETSGRSAYVNRMKIGKGALSFRLHDMIPMVNEQMAGMADGAIKQSYSGFRDALVDQIRKGRGNAGLELANIAFASLGRESTAPLLSGIKSSTAIDLNTWLRSGSTALGGRSASLDQVRSILSQGALSESALEGTVHARGYLGEVIKLPKQFSFAIGDRQLSTNYLPIVSDQFLGASGHEMGKYLTSKGIRNLGLPRKKAILTALLQQHGADLQAGLETGGTKALTAAASEYMNALYMALPGKRGLAYHNLVGAPKSSFSGIAVNLGSVMREGKDDALTMALNPSDAKRLLKMSGYSKGEIKNILSGKEEVITNAFRYPVHRGANLNSLRLKIHKNVAKGTIAVSDVLMKLMHGDFDKDTVSGFLLKDQQENLKRIHEHRSKIVNAYKDLVYQRETNDLIKVVNKIQAGELASEFSEEFFKSAPVASRYKEQIAKRLGSAAGGGVYVGPIHQGWARFNALAQALEDDNSQEWIEAIAKDSPDLAKRISALKNERSFIKKMGTLQETGIYGILKKGAMGFGTESTSALSALLDLGEGKISIDQAKETFKAGFTQAFKNDQLELVDELDMLKKYGIDSLDKSNAEKIGHAMTEELFTGNGHRGIADLAELRSFMKDQALPDTFYEIARGQIGPSTGPEYLAQRQTSAAHAILGNVDTEPLTSESADTAARNVTRVIRDMAESSNQTVLDKALEMGADPFTTSSPGMSKIGSYMRSVGTDLKAAFRTQWGKRIAGAAGLVLGIGALDSLLGSDDNGPVQQAMFNPGGAPLPPSGGISVPDVNVEPPTAESFRMRNRAPARIERPYGTRHNYSVSSRSEGPIDFGVINSHLGLAGRNAPSNAIIVEDDNKNINDRYEMRQRMRSSF